jgi:hypothetical protein
MALESGLVTTDTAEAIEFFAVPTTITNGTASIEGAVPESLFVDGVLKRSASEPNPGHPPATGLSGRRR